MLPGTVFKMRKLKLKDTKKLIQNLPPGRDLEPKCQALTFVPYFVSVVFIHVTQVAWHLVHSKPSIYFSFN